MSDWQTVVYKGVEVQAMQATSAHCKDKHAHVKGVTYAKNGKLSAMGKTPDGKQTTTTGSVGAWILQGEDGVLCVVSVKAMRKHGMTKAQAEMNTATEKEPVPPENDGQGSEDGEPATPAKPSDT